MSNYRIAKLNVQEGCSTFPAMLPVWHKSEVGQRLVVLRAAVGMKQAALAGAIGISSQKLNNYERGRDALPYEHAASICQVTGVHFDYIYRGMMDRLDPDLKVALIKALRAA